jgi:hypothetical protein
MRSDRVLLRVLLPWEASPGHPPRASAPSGDVPIGPKLNNVCRLRPSRHSVSILARRSVHVFRISGRVIVRFLLTRSSRVKPGAGARPPHAGRTGGRPDPRHPGQVPAPARRDAAEAAGGDGKVRALRAWVGLRGGQPTPAPVLSSPSAAPKRRGPLSPRPVPSPLKSGGETIPGSFGGLEHSGPRPPAVPMPDSQEIRLATGRPYADDRRILGSVPRV